MTKFQTASLLNLGALWRGISPGTVLSAAGGLATAYYNARYQSTRDFTGIRVFRMFQHFRVRNRCLSISGSSINTLVGGSLLAKSIKFAGVTVGLPNERTGPST